MTTIVSAFIAILLTAQHPAHHGAHGAAGQAVVQPPRLTSGSYADYIRPDDYPQAALAARQAGTVGFRLTVGSNGRVVKCAITRSSQVPILDASTCRVLRSRLRFAPATDASGKLVTGTLDGQYRWILPPADRG